MPRRLRTIIACLASLVLALPMTSSAYTADAGTRNDCWGQWYIDTGTDSGAKGYRVDFIALRTTSKYKQFKTGKWSGDELAAGATASSAWHSGPCRPELADIGLDYSEGPFANVWQVEGIRLRICRHKSLTSIVRSYVWSGPAWIDAGRHYFDPEIIDYGTWDDTSRWPLS